jgi:superfamily I DNA/RNA helicase
MDCDNCGNKSEALEEVPAGNFKRNRRGATTGSIGVCDLCSSQFRLRDEAVAKVIASGSPKKLIVAGPGAGKTHTFRRLVESLPEGSKVLIFTLINNLVDDLRVLELIPGREVRVSTFHGFCKSLLYQEVGGAGEFSYSGTLSSLIEQDTDLLDLEFDFDPEQAFSELREGEDSVTFYIRRADYYEAVGYVDSVYRVFAFFRERPQSIPQYALVIADEYQDFNRLEAAFIDLLATKSPALLAGDDDQALYSFRFASHEFIRAVFGNADFENFNLPLCSRCPPVLIEAAKAFIDNAIAKGNLKDRIPKDFECYWPEKFVEHGLYPKILHAHCSTRTTAHAVVENEIRRLYALGKDEIDKSKDIPFLIIGPNSRHQLKGLHDYLADKIGSDFDLDLAGKSAFQIEEGYELLRTNTKNNLGWRIVLFHSPLEREEMSRIIRETYENNTNLAELLPADYLKYHLEQAEKVADEEKPEVQEKSKPKVKFATFLGAKGLSARHVFVIGMNDGEFPENPKALTDAEACQFIVALTRARFSCSLISHKLYSKELHRLVNRPSMFLRMIPDGTKRNIALKIRKGKLVKA